jgi:hypothetical protein
MWPYTLLEIHFCIFFIFFKGFQPHACHNLHLLTRSIKRVELDSLTCTGGQAQYFPVSSSTLYPLYMILLALWVLDFLHYSDERFVITDA